MIQLQASSVKRRNSRISTVFSFKSLPFFMLEMFTFKYLIVDQKHYTNVSYSNVIYKVVLIQFSIYNCTLIRTAAPARESAVARATELLTRPRRLEAPRRVCRERARAERLAACSHAGRRHHQRGWRHPPGAACVHHLFGTRRANLCELSFSSRSISSQIDSTDQSLM